MSLQLIDWNEFLENPQASALTIGVFDALHLGHLKLIGHVVNNGINPTVLTFKENPKKIMSEENFPGDIYSLKQKLSIFANLGLSRLVLIDFSAEFGKMSGRGFLDLLVNPGKMVFMAVGHDFACGHNRDMASARIAEINSERGIPTELIKPLMLDNELVSSSRIRTAILRGDFKQAELLTGRKLQLDLEDAKVEFYDGAKLSSVLKGDLISFFHRGVYCYDIAGLKRVSPQEGIYEVFINKEKTKAYFSKGKLLLPQKAESIEYIGV